MLASSGQGAEMRVTQLDYGRAQQAEGAVGSFSGFWPQRQWTVAAWELGSNLTLAPTSWTEGESNIPAHQKGKEKKRTLPQFTLEPSDP